nr:uncharacterized protein LOC105472303 isoform X2 [Macaca nemestrina]
MTLSDTAGSEQIQYLGILFLRIPDHQKLCQWSCWRPQNFFLSMTPASPHILKCTFNAVLRKHASYVCPVLGQCLPQSMTLRGLSSLRLAAHEKHARAAADSAGEPPQLEEAKLGSKRMQPSCFSALCSLQPGVAGARPGFTMAASLSLREPRACAHFFQWSSQSDLMDIPGLMTHQHGILLLLLG